MLNTAELPLAEPRSTARGAANDAFASLFAMPFGNAVVSTYTLRDELRVATSAPPPARSGWLRPGTFMGLGLGAAGLLSGAWGAATLLDARGLHDGAAPTITQQEAAALNRDIADRNRNGAVLLGVGIAGVAGGVLILLLQQPDADSGADTPARPARRAAWDVVVGPGALTGGIHGTF